MHGLMRMYGDILGLPSQFLFPLPNFQVSSVPQTTFLLGVGGFLSKCLILVHEMGHYDTDFF